MHPALSIIFFTTASGLGYGLLAWTGLLLAFRLLPLERIVGASTLGLGLVLVAAGLMSSLAHLGRPLRAWRAFSQWRTSWLSREGVMAMITFMPLLTLIGRWAIIGLIDIVTLIAGLIMTVCALVTVYCTAMIYRSLAPIRQWANKLTVPVYLALALMSGACWLHALVCGTGLSEPTTRLITVSIAIVTIPIAYSLKRAAWQAKYDADGPTVQSATGLNAAQVRTVDWPHTEANYLLKEMGYRVARKHAARLRIVATAAGFVVPLVLLIASLGRDGLLPTLAAGVAALSMVLGIAVERWLFFAEAKHTVTLYYNAALPDT